MRELNSCSNSLGSSHTASIVLDVWRNQGNEKAIETQKYLFQKDRSLQNDLLQIEIYLRLLGKEGPRLLIDGLWFSRPLGGITRVWDQILNTWSLPGLFTNNAPICLIERDSHMAHTDLFTSIEGSSLDPIDFSAVEALSDENQRIVEAWNADVFLSSWISNSGHEFPSCLEMALVHDCLPERYLTSKLIRNLRHRWLTGAKTHLAVSQSTAVDIENYLASRSGSVGWCYPAPSKIFSTDIQGADFENLWHSLKLRFGLVTPYLLLPATSAIGSYKNPEIVLDAFTSPLLDGISLVLCGIGANQRVEEIEAFAPHLSGRLIAASFTDIELSVAYRKAIAVVIPSRIEGFGLPAIEALASNAVVLIADSLGLKEAGGNACLRFSSENSKELVQLIELLLDKNCCSFFRPVLERRRKERLASLSPDLLGICLLTLARLLHRKK